MEKFQLNQKHIATCIKVQMVRHDMSVVDLSQKLGVTRMSANNFKQGKITNIYRLWEIAQLFGMTFDELLEIK